MIRVTNIIHVTRVGTIKIQTNNSIILNNLYMIFSNIELFVNLIYNNYREEAKEMNIFQG